MATISNREDTLDVRDIIARVEYIEERLEAERDTRDEREELATLSSLLQDLKGNGGDEQWRGDWYPVTLIRDSYFVEYARELADDLGMLNDTAWPFTCIDWTKAARELRMDYTSTEFEGVTYWFR